MPGATTVPARYTNDAVEMVWSTGVLVEMSPPDASSQSTSIRALADVSADAILNHAENRIDAPREIGMTCTTCRRPPEGSAASLAENDPECAGAATPVPLVNIHTAGLSSKPWLRTRFAIGFGSTIVTSRMSVAVPTLSVNLRKSWCVPTESSRVKLCPVMTA